MIPEIAVKEFLNRPLDDHRWVKKLTHKELDAALANLRPPPKLSKELRIHQKACFLLGVAYPKFLYWLDMGAGKSLLSLELLRYWRDAGRMYRGLVVVRSDKAFWTWEKQFARFNIDIPRVMLEGNSRRKWQQLEELEDGLVFVSYPGLVAMVSSLEKVKKKRVSKRERELDNKLIAKLAKGLDVIVLDESTGVGHVTSLQHMAIRRLRKRVFARYALAGRPFGRDPTMLWAQHHLVDEGESLGPTLGLFRAAFFSEEENPWTNNEYVKDWKFKKRMMPILSRLTGNRSITYTSGECSELPKVNRYVEEVRFPEEAGAYYKRMVEQIIKAKGNLREVKGTFLRMRQLSSGFLGLKDDETGEKVEVEFDDNPKLDRLLELVEELPADRKAIVWYEFTYSGRLITRLLKEQGLNPIWLWSGTKDSVRELKRFERDDDCTVAVINNKVGAYSLDGLQVANYPFFYESPVSIIDREQAERRTIRDGQRFKVFQYDLIVRGSADAKILDFHEEGRDLMKVLQRDPSYLFK